MSLTAALPVQPAIWYAPPVLVLTFSTAKPAVRCDVGGYGIRASLMVLRARQVVTILWAQSLSGRAAEFTTNSLLTLPVGVN